MSPRPESAGTEAWPRGRYLMSVWTDPTGQAYIFGGLTASAGAMRPIAPLTECLPLFAGSGTLADMWRVDPTRDSRPNDAPFTHIAGDLDVNAPPNYCRSPPCNGGTPGSRYGAAAWVASSGRLWVFGGRGLVTPGRVRCATACAYLSDYWSVDPSTGDWRWEGGFNRQAVGGVYQHRANSGAHEHPGSRLMAAAWTDESGAAYLFGGLGYVAPSEGGASPAARPNVVWRPLID